MRRYSLTILLLLGLASNSAKGQFTTFQQGVNGYTGTSDTEVRSADSTLDQSRFMEISVDQSDGSIPGLTNRNQALIKFDNIFGKGSGLVPTDEEILYAEVVFFVTSATDEDAVISMNRVLGPDQNRQLGSGPWQDTDTWFSLGGSVVPNEQNVLELDPVEIGVSSVLAPGNEAFAAPEDPVDNPSDGQLRSSDNLVNLGFVSIPVTQSVRAWQAGAPNNGWVIDNTTGNGWDFVSSDLSVADIEDPSEAAGVQALLDNFGLTEEQVRPQLRVGLGVNGDFDFDGDIDTDDYDILRFALGNDLENRAEPGDVDFDADVDLDDFFRFKAIFDELNGAGAFNAMTSSVPEPGSVSLMLVVMGVAWFTHRRKAC